MTKKVEEFFYVDADGNKQDRDLHNPILRAVDYPIDDTIMGPIRERNRRKYLAEQKERHAKLKMQQRLAKAKKRYGLDRERTALDLTQFKKPLPPRTDGQTDLFA